jgi:uncharacterized protein with PhoU and TrkA domain
VAVAVEQKMENTVVTVGSGAVAKAVKEPLQAVALLKVGLSMERLTQAVVAVAHLVVQKQTTTVPLVDLELL